MKYCSVLYVLVFCISCKPLALNSEITDKGAYRFYKSVSKGSELYETKYNADSTYVICFQMSDPRIPNESISFLIVNAVAKSKVFQSMKEYNKAEWIDNQNILLTKYSGIEKRDKKTGLTMGNQIKYIFNVNSGDISNFVKSNQETP